MLKTLFWPSLRLLGAVLIFLFVVVPTAVGMANVSLAAANIGAVLLLFIGAVALMALAVNFGQLVAKELL